MLIAKASDLQHFLSKSLEQFVVPVFQRPYFWEKQQWQVFWEDLSELHDSKSNRQHFLGVILTMRVGLSPENVWKHLILDGQQRLVTASILLSAIRDSSVVANDYFSDAINNLLWIEAWNPNSNKEPKLLLTSKDKEAFQSILKREKRPEGVIPRAYDYFLGQIKSRYYNSLDYNTLFKTLVTQCIFVNIELSPNEDPYKIISTLNFGSSHFPKENPFPQLPSLSGAELSFVENQLLNYRKFPQAPELLALISGGENAQTEFKEAACVNPHTGNPDNKMREQIVKSVAAFMNSQTGGTLLIGVADDGEIKGINHEFAIANKSKVNWDGYSLFITDLLNTTLGIVTPFQFYTVSRYSVDGKDVCCVSVKPATLPVYINKKLYARAGSQSLELQGPDLLSYVKERWGSS